jgi:hypothetical protein
MKTGRILDVTTTLSLSDRHQVAEGRQNWPRCRTLLERVTFRATEALNLHVSAAGQMACKAVPSEPNVLRLESVDQRLTSGPNLPSGAEQGRRLASRDKLTSEIKTKYDNLY